MSLTPSRPSVPQTLLRLFEQNFDKERFAWYREGDPIHLPASRLPALIVTETETGYDVGPTGHDQITHTIRIKVVLNKKDEMGNPTVTSSLEAILDRYVQGRSDTTGDFLSDTIMGVLRRNISIGNLAIEQTASVKKGVVPRPDDVLTSECWIDITIVENQAIANRA